MSFKIKPVALSLDPAQHTVQEALHQTVSTGAALYDQWRKEFPGADDLTTIQHAIIDAANLEQEYHENMVDNVLDSDASFAQGIGDVELMRVGVTQGILAGMAMRSNEAEFETRLREIMTKAVEIKK